jgi:hypothetical protein
MSENSDLWVEWVKEVRVELKERRDENEEIWKDLHKLWIAHEKLDTKVTTRNKIIWALITLLIAAAGVIIALLALFN